MFQYSIIQLFKPCIIFPPFHSSIIPSFHYSCFCEYFYPYEYGCFCELFLDSQFDTSFRRGAEKVSDLTPYRILLADDHAVLRQDLRHILEGRNDLEVIGEAADGLELLDLLQMTKLTPDMVIVDVTMPNLGGIEATRRIKAAYPDIKVLILTIHKEKEYLSRAFSAGANGYVLKEECYTELLSAIEMIRKGAVYVSPLLSENPINGEN